LSLMSLWILLSWSWSCLEHLYFQLYFEELLIYSNISYRKYWFIRFSVLSQFCYFQMAIQNLFWLYLTQQSSFIYCHFSINSNTTLCNYYHFNANTWVDNNNKNKIFLFCYFLVGVTVAMILDFNNSNLAMYDGGQRFMIFMFQTVNTRFGGILNKYFMSLEIKYNKECIHLV